MWNACSGRFVGCGFIRDKSRAGKGALAPANRLSCRIDPMSLRRTLILVPAILTATLVLTAAQSDQRATRRWAQYEREMQDPVPDPPDAYVEGEFAVGRLRFHSPQDGYRQRRWGVDANK